MNAIVPFDFEGQAVRVVPDNAGLPWFVAADVCRCLEIGNSRDAISRLDDDEKGVANTDTLGGAQKMAIVSEPGVYRLVFTSRKPSAERFKRWLAHDVLPTIRRTGGYPAAAPAMDLPADLRVQVEMVREARLTFGRSAAQRLWHVLALPAVDTRPPALPGPAPEECLAYLLSHVATWGGETMALGRWLSPYEGGLRGSGNGLVGGLVAPEVAVGVHGELDGGMPGPGCHLLGRGALFDPQGDRHMP
ncbi:Prophage antirepressor protein (modular protein) [Magnetospirillum sp. UT-4]|nr:Prophage antirepressor protein (modular protein) [Magnetospirillum sp. UT-4]